MLFVAVGLLPVVGALIWFLGDTGFWIGVIGYVVSLVSCFGWMSSGKAERYEIMIDTATKTISVSDRVRGVQLWEDDFNPDWVRLAHIQVVLSGEPYKHPVLVYSEDPIELVIDAVPTSTRALLGFGEQEEIEAVCQLLGQVNSTEA